MASKLLLSVSTLNFKAKANSYPTPVGGTSIPDCLQSNEAPAKYLLSQHQDITEIIALVSHEAQNTNTSLPKHPAVLEKGNNHGEWGYLKSVINEYCDQIGRSHPNYKKIDCEMTTDFKTIVWPQLESLISKKDILYIETTGGSRYHIQNLLLHLPYAGYHIQEITYSDLDTRPIAETEKRPARIYSDTLTTVFPPYKGDGNYIFMSYSHKDKATVSHLINQLHGRGYNIWYDAHIGLREDWNKEIKHHLSNCSYVIIWVSKSFLRSRYCREELCQAIAEDKPILAIYLEKNVSLKKSRSKLITSEIKRKFDQSQGIEKYEFETLIDLLSKIDTDEAIQNCRDYTGFSDRKNEEAE